MSVFWAEYERRSREKIAEAAAQRAQGRACEECGHPIKRGKMCADCASDSKARRMREYRARQRMAGAR